MRMDIACPAELRRVEQARFGEGRAQAYLTFLSETEQVITGLSGRLTLLDEDGRPIERRKVTFTNLKALPGERFVCHLALDTYPPFETAQIALELVTFEAEELWELDSSRLMDVTPPELENGPERVALVAVAGHDAVCFPEKRGAIWVCVCGRFNRWRWGECRRCHRGRDETFEVLTKDKVTAAYQEHIEAVRSKDMQRLNELAQESQAQRQKKSAVPAKSKRAKKRGRRVLAALACVLAASLLVWGGLKLLGARLETAETRPVAAEETKKPEIDYL